MRPFGSDLPSCANGLCRGQKDNWSLWCTPQRQRTCTSASAYEQPNALHPWLVSNRTQQAAMQGRVRDRKMCSDAHLHSRSQFLTFLCFLLREKGLTYSWPAWQPAQASSTATRAINIISSSCLVWQLAQDKTKIYQTCFRRWSALFIKMFAFSLCGDISNPHPGQKRLRPPGEQYYTKCCIQTSKE